MFNNLSSKLKSNITKLGQKIGEHIKWKILSGLGIGMGLALGSKYLSSNALPNNLMGIGKNSEDIFSLASHQSQVRLIAPLKM